MNADLNSLVIMRAANGWIVREPVEYHMGNLPNPTGMQVARTPDELAQIITEWAAKQEEKA